MTRARSRVQSVMVYITPLAKPDPSLSPGYTKVVEVEGFGTLRLVLSEYDESTAIEEADNLRDETFLNAANFWRRP